jgi:hypothetical protein
VTVADGNQAGCSTALNVPKEAEGRMADCAEASSTASEKNVRINQRIRCASTTYDLWCFVVCLRRPVRIVGAM